MTTDILGPANASNSTTTRPADGRTIGGTDTWFQDCTTPTSGDGTDITAAQLNSILANLRALTRVNGNLGTGAQVVAEDNTDTMLARSVGQFIQRGQNNYAVDTGSADALVCNPPTAFEEYKAGMFLFVKKGSSPNATTTPTITISGIGALNIIRADTTAIQPNDLPANGLLFLFLDGTNARLIGIPPAAVRIKLVVNITMFINASTGNDLNFGSSSFPFRTRQGCWNYLQNFIDMAGFTVTVDVANMSVTDSLIAIGPITGCLSEQSLVFVGNVSSPASCAIAVVSGSCWRAHSGARFSIRGFRHAASGSGLFQGFGCLSEGPGSSIYMDHCDFGVHGVAHIGCLNGGQHFLNGAYSVFGNSPAHYYAFNGGNIYTLASLAVTFSSPCTFSSAFASCNGSGSGINLPGITFSGSTVSGQRYLGSVNCALQTNGGGANYFPGSIAGSVTFGGQYI